MTFHRILFVSAFILSLIIILTISFKSKHFFKSVLLTALSGAGSLFALQLLSCLTHITLPVNVFTVAVSTLSGIPGVVALLLTSFTV